MDAEQITFEFDFEIGEHKAPVSSLYKKFINEMLHSAIDYGEPVHFFQVMALKNSILKSDLFLKTSKQFQKEVHALLDLPFADLYEALKGEPYIKTDTDTNISTNNKPNLKLVK